MTGKPGRPSDPAQLGRHVRRLREARGLSLSELARRAGLGKATLSGIENGTRNPTLETLWAITAQFGVPLTALLEGQGEVYGTAVEAKLLQVFDDGEVSYELYRIRVPPGVTQSSPAHHAGVTEHITVFRGTLRAGPPGRPMTAGPGEYLTWTADEPHTYAALGEEVVEASLLMRYVAPQAGLTASPSSDRPGRAAASSPPDAPSGAR
ncbi:helix-turn-helix domain-containing protein [Nonomuraea sp. NPDC050328]|uniref:helix-turn-helix domain-containing protein n=1 Tax=Nonomuraea sp. NPDC050328 TaxID=3364361 RepID=UPI00378C6E7A